MGGLLAFRVGNYDNTAEREQFRYLCERLKAHYAKLEDFCVFAGNYNIGCELDALFIKKDAIIAIEFKNYGGHVIASENGEWTCNGQMIKGGSRKTVLQQARINHSIVKKELRELGVESNNIKDVPTLIIFNQSIELENNLSATTKSWLHITDNENFMAKLDDITCPKTDLSPLDIVNLAELLNLNSFYLEEFSNASCDKPSSSQKAISICQEIKSSYLSEPSGYGTGTIDNHIKNNYELDIPELNTEESKSLKSFVLQILSSIIKIPDTIITIHDGFNSMSKLSLYGISVTKKYLVRVKAEGIGKYCSKISRFINHEVNAIGANLVYWQEGDVIEKQKVNNSVNIPLIEKGNEKNEGM